MEAVLLEAALMETVLLEAALMESVRMETALIEAVLMERVLIVTCKGAVCNNVIRMTHYLSGFLLKF